MTIATSRTLQLGALTGAVVVGVGVYVFIGGLAGGLYAAAALVFGLFSHFKLSSSGEAAPKSSEPYWNRWGRSRAELDDLQEALETERALVAERDTHVDVLRRELEEQRQLARTLEGRYLKELAALEAAHQADAEQVSAGLTDLEQELAGFERIVEDLAGRATVRVEEESPHEGASFLPY
jgi:hypothetical protein